MFSWIPIHQETVRHLLSITDPQPALLAILREMDAQDLKVISLSEKGPNGETPLTEIDPLTFFASFNRQIKNSNRQRNWEFLKEKWGLSADVPSDFTGIPVVHNMSSWFFPNATKRERQHVPLLWELVRQAVERPVREIDEKLFDQCIELDKLSIVNLTIGLFWVAPTRFLPADAKTLAYAADNGVVRTPDSYQTYTAWLSDVTEKLGHEYHAISHEAHVWSESEDEPDSEPEMSSGRRFWVYAPGENANAWEELHQEGLMAIGWDELGDLSSYPDRESMRLRLIEGHKAGSSKHNNALACWQFANEIQPGDIVFAKRGRKKLLGYGEVSGDYEYRHGRALPQVRAVSWKAKGEWDLQDYSLPLKTLTDITKYQTDVEMLSSLVGAGAVEEEPAKGVNYWWLNANPKIWNFDQLSVGAIQTYTSFNEKGNKRQKYKYFQQVKPGDMVVGYVTSPHREVASICQITQGLHTLGDSEQIALKIVEHLAEPIGYDTLQSTPSLASAEPLVSNQGSLFKLTEAEFDVIRALIDDANPAPLPPPVAYSIRDGMRDVFATEAQFIEMLSALREKKNVVLQGPPGVGKTFVAKKLAYALMGVADPQRVETIQFHQSYSYEDFIQGLKPTPKGTFELRSGAFYRFCQRARRDEQSGKPYVFVIDEINRGNLSKIFGELMMLVEPDKRGPDHAIPLTYSASASDTFYVPQNVYILGTMNTADRSLAMVDYALRRRFRFVALRPAFGNEGFRTHLVECGASAALVDRIVARIGVLNKEIEDDKKNLGPGYQVGHSYFCPPPDVVPDDDWYRRVIEFEVVPLIGEYWFDDEERVSKRRATLLA